MFKFTKSQTVTDTTPAEVQRQLAAGDNLLVLDVRQPDEYQEGHVAGSRLIPLDQLSLRLDELPKEGPIAVICRSGNRSSVASGMLQRAGYDAANVSGGMLRWEREGLPMERGR